jgi:hypothetical protein
MDERETYYLSCTEEPMGFVSRYTGPSGSSREVGTVAVTTCVSLQ